MMWTRKGNGYYVATGVSGIALTIVYRPAAGRAPSGLRAAWLLYAGDNTAVRTQAETLRDAKATAQRLFG